MLYYVDDCINWYTYEELGKLFVVRGDLQNKEMIGYTWSTTASMRIIKYFLSDDSKHKVRVHQLYFIGVFLQDNVKHTPF